MTLQNADKLPQQIGPLLHEHVCILLDALGAKLTGVYVHGSAAIGGFVFSQSDLDYLAIVAGPLAVEERRALADSFLEIYGRNTPAKGVEMSIVVERFAGKEFRYPTPYEFHMGTEEQVRFFGATYDSEKTDPDLAAHFTVAKNRGLCVHGKPIDQVFAEVPKKYFLASITLDSEESFRNIREKTCDEQCIVPRYAVLNFCRVLAFIDKDMLLSKMEGGEWGLRELPARYRPIVASALQEQREAGSSERVDSVTLVDFAVYAMNRIREATSRLIDGK